MEWPLEELANEKHVLSCVSINVNAARTRLAVLQSGCAIRYDAQKVSPSVIDLDEEEGFNVKFKHIYHCKNTCVRGPPLSPRHATVLSPFLSSGATQICRSTRVRPTAASFVLHSLAVSSLILEDTLTKRTNILLYMEWPDVIWLWALTCKISFASNFEAPKPLNTRGLSLSWPTFPSTMSAIKYLDFISSHKFNIYLIACLLERHIGRQVSEKTMGVIKRITTRSPPSYGPCVS